MKYSRVSEEYTGQPMFQILQDAQALERKGKRLYHFELGDPDFSTAPYIIDAAVDALKSGKTHYSPSSGERVLLEAARSVTKKSRGFEPEIEQLLVTPGANMQIYLALACMCNPKELVAIPVPYFPSYIAQVKALGLTPYLLPCDNTYKIDPAMLRSMKPKVLILNYPSNPTGVMYTAAELWEIYVAAREVDAWVIADEVYARLLYDGEFHSMSQFDGCKERVVVVNGLSKSFAMTGWRVGIMTGPQELVRRMTVLQESICSCVSQFVQIGAAAALKGDQKPVMKQIAEYKSRRDTMVKALKNVKSLHCHVPEGGLYCWAKIMNGMKSNAYARWAIKRGVVLSPGYMFGMGNHVRFSFANSCTTIEEGIGRLL